MIIELANTETRKIQAALTTTRHRMGGAATGKVLTLIIVTTEAAQYDAVRASTQAAREHPSRILGVIPRAVEEEARLDAEVRLGETGPGETVLLRLYGEVAQHAGAVVLPLLVPDTPVVIWWPGAPPERPSGDPLGAMAQRRVTDAAAGTDPLGTLKRLATGYSPGDTDLTWTRITPWRSLLASILDRPPDTDITAAEVEAEADDPSAELLGGWLSARLSVPCEVCSGYGPDITAVRLFTKSGQIAVTRPDGRVATLSRPDQPDRQVALHRRPTAELIAEELRHLDPDQAYQEAVTRYAKEKGGPVA
ncbi:glucose-6-phosphate dehydrogenase assembly protein OpcA [Actinoallomurus spadix]|uniref:Glucose-6-phosphate dehydrogenase assembly protein OpcA n=1 Tax=Actinoallomurus spadix TaxID=79912 RepID=A0ABP3G973_9ACTN|nr:glucose-6-phosphate dehydrogenase assembly protein OpcA [Actinoallomurus spadix]MCO5990576.1 glucose-6-phosphate dehydrogenase assembly protein OpcA [Actinoallomurus spadix]